MSRLQMGMKNLAAIFQNCIEQCIHGSKGTLVYQDDVLVTCRDGGVPEITPRGGEEQAY